MAGGKNNGGSKPFGSRARSVGAAGGMKPAGAILDDPDFYMKKRRDNFDMWKATKATKLKRNAAELWFMQNEHPIK